MDEIVTSALSYDETLGMKSIIGSRVLSKRGTSIGRVSRARLHPKTRKLEAIVIRRGILKTDLYVDNAYIDRLSDETVILTIEPSLLLKGKKVITAEGELVGKVAKVERKEQTNQIKQIMVKPFLRRPFLVPIAEVKSLGSSIILKPSYHVPKKSIWRR